jgi:hypothetical protein
MTVRFGLSSCILAPDLHAIRRDASSVRTCSLLAPVCAVFTQQLIETRFLSFPSSGNLCADRLMVAPRHRPWSRLEPPGAAARDSSIAIRNPVQSYPAGTSAALYMKCAGDFTTAQNDRPIKPLSGPEINAYLAALTMNVAYEMRSCSRSIPGWNTDGVFGFCRGFHGHYPLRASRCAQRTLRLRMRLSTQAPAIKGYWVLVRPAPVRGPVCRSVTVPAAPEQPPRRGW